MFVYPGKGRARELLPLLVWIASLVHTRRIISRSTASPVVPGTILQLVYRRNVCMCVCARILGGCFVTGTLRELPRSAVSAACQADLPRMLTLAPVTSVVPANIPIARAAFCVLPVTLANSPPFLSLRLVSIADRDHLLVCVLFFL